MTFRVTKLSETPLCNNQTSSCCCHGDERLRFNASDCLSGALCSDARGRGLIWGVFMCAPALQLPPPGRAPCCSETVFVKPAIASALHPHHHLSGRETIQLLFLIRGWYCSAGEGVSAAARPALRSAAQVPANTQAGAELQSDHVSAKCRGSAVARSETDSRI